MKLQLWAPCGYNCARNLPAALMRAFNYLRAQNTTQRLQKNTLKFFLPLPISTFQVLFITSAYSRRILSH